MMCSCSQVAILCYLFWRKFFYSLSSFPRYYSFVFYCIKHFEVIQMFFLDLFIHHCLKKLNEHYFMVSIQYLPGEYVATFQETGMEPSPGGRKLGDQHQSKNLISIFLSS